jgi:hypothetical protein
LFSGDALISINSINFYNIYIMKLFFMINLQLQILCLIVDEIYRNYWSKIDLTRVPKIYGGEPGRHALDVKADVGAHA